MRTRWLLGFIVALAALMLSGCGGRALLSDVMIEPQVISPNADGTDDVAMIHYRIRDDALLTMYFVDSAGARHVFREGESRSPAKQAYIAYFGGSIDGKLLPDGEYTCVIEAVSQDGRTVRAEHPLTIRGGDRDRMEIQNLVIAPNVFTPNRDGIKDRVTISYYLNKEAAYLEVYITDGAGNRYPVPDDAIRDIGAPGNHQHDYDAGVDLGATPPPDGVYTVWVVAEDAVGNRDVQKASLTIEMGGVPQVTIVKRAARWSSKIVPLGGTLTFTCTVENIGRVPVRTKGPEPGTIYNTSQNFNSLSQSLGLPVGDDYYEEPGIFRIGADYEANTSARPYPFRWQLGRTEELTLIDGELYLMPGQTVEVTGSIAITEQPIKIAPYFWVGLLHEQVRWVEENIERTQISVGF